MAPAPAVSDGFSRQPVGRPLSTRSVATPKFFRSNRTHVANANPNSTELAELGPLLTSIALGCSISSLFGREIGEDGFKGDTTILS